VCNSSKEELGRRLKKTIKWFMGLTKTVSDDVLFYLVDVDFSEWGRVEEARARKRWEARVERNPVGFLEKFKIKCKVRYLPKEVAHFINLQCAVCKRCGTRLSADHYRVHGVGVPSVQDLCLELQQNLNLIEGSGVKCQRDTILKVLGWKVQTYLDEMISFLQK